MRLIDKETLLAKAIACHFTKAVVELIERQEEVDAVPVVRCKDCKYGNTWKCNISEGDDWFCADGERKTDATD